MLAGISMASFWMGFGHVSSPEERFKFISQNLDLATQKATVWALDAQGPQVQSFTPQSYKTKCISLSQRLIILFSSKQKWITWTNDDSSWAKKSEAWFVTVLYLNKILTPGTWLTPDGRWWNGAVVVMMLHLYKLIRLLYSERSS